MFQICTIVNKPAQYADMKASMLAAGFSEDRCRYEVFDNAAANMHEPYQTINRVMTAATEPYVIFCHQDLLLNKGHGFDQLVGQLNGLNTLDPNWAIAGNAGRMGNLMPAMKIDDPHGSQVFGELPQKVYSLDENFFVLKTASQLRCSQALAGFHLYATDLCLQATRRGLSCYVIDFHLTHLSGGSFGADFYRGLAEFQQHWNRAFFLCVVRTPCAFFCLSRSRVIRRLARTDQGMDWVKKHIGMYLRITQAKRQVQRGYRRLRYGL